jgi:DNA-binding MltR family transcriptional regulator
MDMDRDIEDVLRDLGVKIKMVYGLPIIKKYSMKY